MAEQTSKKPSAATVMLELARALYRVVRDETTGKFFAQSVTGGDFTPLGQLGPVLDRLYAAKTGKVPPANAKTQVLDILADLEAPRENVTAKPPSPEELAQAERERQERIAMLELEAGTLIDCEGLLKLFDAELTASIWVGETIVPQLVFVNTFTTLLAIGEYKPVRRLGSLRVGGSSGTGKNFAVERARAFLPDDVFYAVTSSSEKALVYSPVDVRRRLLYYPEGGALELEGIGAGILRSLLTENRVAHETVIDGSWQRLEKEGPTGAVIATSAVKLDRDLENRLDRVDVSDDVGQTEAIIKALGASAASGQWDPPDLSRWHSYFDWLREQAPFEVLVPYGEALAALIPAAAVRLRRDVSQLIGLIWATTVLHYPHRERDECGRLIAEMDDYAAVRPLINAGIGIATGESVPDWMHETWEQLPSEDGITFRELGRRLQMTDDGAAKRVRQMIELGFADNLETRPRAAAQVIRKTEPPAPGDVGFLPTPDAVLAKAEEMASYV